jgi:uncharacterized protein
MSLIFMGNAGIVLAQTSDYQVVFDLTSKDSTDHQTVIRWANEISKAYPGSQLEIVLYGKSLDMVRKDRSTVSAQVMKLGQNKNTAIKVCAIAMKNQNVQQSELLPGVQTVPDGIYEIVKKQKDGWGYIKVSH